MDVVQDLMQGYSPGTSEGPHPRTNKAAEMPLTLTLLRAAYAVATSRAPQAAALQSQLAELQQRLADIAAPGAFVLVTKHGASL